jgi:hypothetical protein
VADKYDAMIDAVSGGGDKYDAMIDAVADTQGPLSSEPTSPLARAIGSFLESKKAPEAVNQLKTDLLTNEPIQGFGNNMVRGLPATVGGIAAGPIGAAALESARQGAVGINSAMGGTQAPSLVDALGRPVLAGVTQQAADLAAPYFGQALVGGTVKPSASPLLTAGTHQLPQEVGGALGFAGNVAKGTLDYLQRNLGGLSKGTADLINENASAVAQRLGLSREDIGALAEKLRSAISGAVDSAGTKYAEVANAITRGEQVPAINLKGTIGEGVDAIKKTYGYSAPIPGTPDAQAATGLLDQFGSSIAKTIPGKAPLPGVDRIVSPDEAAKFGKFAGLIGKLDQATPEQVYYLQRDINHAIMSNRGTPLARALGEVKGLINQSLPQMAEQSGSPALAKLAEANAGYAAAHELQDSASGLNNANDAIQYIKNAYSPNKYSSQAKDTLEAVGKQVAPVGALIREARLAMAAEEAGHLLRPIPQNGAGAGMVAGAGMLAGDAMGAGSVAASVAKKAAMAAFLPVFSPRAYLGAAQVSQAAGPALAGAAKATAQVAQGAVPALAQAFAHMTPESISAFYKSP